VGCNFLELLVIILNRKWVLWCPKMVNVIYSCKSFELFVMYIWELHFAWTFRHSNAWDWRSGGEGHEILQLLYRCSLKSLQKQSSCLLCSYFQTSTNSWLGFEFQDIIVKLSASCTHSHVQFSTTIYYHSIPHIPFILSICLQALWLPKRCEGRYL